MKNSKAFILLLILLIVIGCKEATHNDDNDNLLEMPVFNEKLNAYIGVNNYVIYEHKGSSFNNAINKFISIYGDKTNPNLEQEDPTVWLGNNYNWGINVAIEPALELNKQEPIIPRLDSLEVILFDQIKSTNKKLDAFLSYYKQKEYLNDDYAQAKKMHPEIIDAIDLTFQKYHIVNSELDLWITKRDSIDLIQLKDTEKINYHLKYATKNAEGILDEIKKQGITNATIITLDLTEINQYSNKLKESSTSLTSLMNDEKELQRSNINTFSMLQGFNSHLDEFIGQINSLKKRVKDQESFTSKEIEYLSKDKRNKKNGSINVIYTIYNEMIDDYNYIQ